LVELRLLLVTDRHQTRGRELVGVVRACLDAGLPAVQVREKDLEARELAPVCRALREPTRERGALLIVNDRADVALAVGADGVQRTATSLSVADLRTVADKRLLIGASVHSLDEARAAEDDGADWVVFGPVYDTPSKRMFGAPQGLHALERVSAAMRIPVIAIGGITVERVRPVRATGAAGVAVISAILDTDSPAEATRQFIATLGDTAA
jgi:thiamine-phosphate pyrophosphorylase